MAIRLNTNSFIYGVDEYPDWFALNSQTGKVKYVYSEGGKLIQTLVATVKGFEPASKGDTIMAIGNDMAVIPGEVAKMFGVE